MKHEDSGWRCTASHLVLPEDDGAPCIVCKHCGQFIRPCKMDEECLGYQPIDWEAARKQFKQFWQAAQVGQADHE